MSPIFLIALLSTSPAQAQNGVAVKSAHSALTVDGEQYQWLRPGKPMRLQVTRKKGQELHVDVVRLGPASAKQGAAELVVRVGRKNEKIRVRPPLEDSRTVDGSAKLASYPVRHRFDLPFSNNAVRLTVTGGGAEGVGVRVSVGERKRSRLALAPLGAGKKRTKKSGEATTKKVERREKKATKSDRRRRRGRKAKSKEPAKAVKVDDKNAKEAVAAAAAKKAAEDTAKKEAEAAAAKEAAAKKAEADAAATARAEEAAAKDAATKEAAGQKGTQTPTAKAGANEAGKTDETTVGGEREGAKEGGADDGQTTGGEREGSAGTDRNAPPPSTTFVPQPVPPQTTEIVLEPERPQESGDRLFTLHVGAGAGAVTLGSALFPLGLHLGGRALFGLNDGWLSRYEFGIGADFDSEAARVSAEGLAQAVDWSTQTVRIRAEMAAKVFETEFDLDGLKLPVDAAVVLGAGALVGRHNFLIGKRSETRFAFGPTARVGIQGAMGIGPGAVTLVVPVDASWDVASGVTGYVPVVGSIFLGYRLSL